MKNKTIRILSIGNSYSLDQQTYVHQMAQAAGYDIEVCIAYIGGCSFRKHLEMYDNNEPAYTYYENGKIVGKKLTLRRLVTLKKWDFVNFQKGTEGQNYQMPSQPYVSYLVKIVREFHPDAKLVYSISWPDAETSARAIFRDQYRRDRDYQWEVFVRSAREVCEECRMDYAIPAGLAMRYAYEKFGASMHRDGFHSSEMGRYLHACVWFEFFTGLPAPEDFLPCGATYTGGIAPDAETCADLRECASRALEKLKAEGGDTPALFARENGFLNS